MGTKLRRLGVFLLDCHLVHKNFGKSNNLLTFDVSNVNDMILSFGSKENEQIWNGIRVKNLPIDIQNVGRRKLRMLNNYKTLPICEFHHQTVLKSRLENS